MIPIARQYPGARVFVESYRKAFPGADLSYISASGYGSCQILVEAVRRAGSLHREKPRDAIRKAPARAASVFGMKVTKRQRRAIGRWQSRAFDASLKPRERA